MRGLLHVSLTVQHTPLQLPLSHFSVMTDHRKMKLLAECHGCMPCLTNGLVRTQYVLDGGALLHGVRWTKNMSFAEIADLYVSHVARCYGQNVHVVFDGYEAGASVKDHEHMRHKNNTGSVSPDVVVDVSRCLTFDQQVFLSNENNKDGCIAVQQCCNSGGR